MPRQAQVYELQGCVEKCNASKMIPKVAVKKIACKCHMCLHHPHVVPKTCHHTCTYVFIHTCLFKHMS